MPWWGWLLTIWLGSAVVLVSPLIVLTVAQRTRDLLLSRRASGRPAHPPALDH